MPAPGPKERYRTGLANSLEETTGDVECPLWVKSRHIQCTTPCPLYPRKRTPERPGGMSAKGQKANLYRATSQSSFLPMRITTIAATIRFSNVRNESLGVIMFDLERSNQRILSLDRQNVGSFPKS